MYMCMYMYTHTHTHTHTQAMELAKEMDERVQREDFLVKQPKASKARNKLQV